MTVKCPLCRKDVHVNDIWTHDRFEAGVAGEYTVLCPDITLMRCFNCVNNKTTLFNSKNGKIYYCYGGVQLKMEHI